jgi:hypothetical protein
MAMGRIHLLSAPWLAAFVALASMGVFACSGLKSAPDDADAGDDASLDSAAAAEVSSPTEASVETDAGASDGATKSDAAGAPSVELTMSAACDQPWKNLVYQGPPQVAGSMSVVSATTNGRVTLIRKTTQTELSLSSAANRAGGDILQVYANGQLFMSSCNVGTGPCVYTPSPPSYANDPIAGTVKVVRYDDATRAFELELTGVVLQSATSGALCEVSGRVSAN